MTIIINADDFAISENTNNTILFLHKQGVVTSTTIMANGKYFSQAVEISKDNPKLGVGVHLCLDGPFNVGRDYKSIMDRNSNLFFDIGKIYKKAKSFSVYKSEIYREYCLQIEKVLDHGIRISHLDHHHHLHLFLPVLDSMIKAAKKYKIRYIRSQKVFHLNQENFFKHIYKNTHQLYLTSRISAVDGYFTLSITDSTHYENHYSRLSELLRIENKIIEIMVHPQYKDDPETMFYSSKKVMDLLSNQNLISYHDLIKESIQNL
jgi:chitin disaccharide deacetylase